MSKRIKFIRKILKATSILILLLALIGAAMILYEKYGIKEIKIKKDPQKAVPVKAFATTEKPEEKEIIYTGINMDKLKNAINKVSKEEGINPQVFWAIIECEKGDFWTINKTSDIGVYQINLQTARQFGMEDLSDLIDPYKSTKFAAKIIKEAGIRRWVTYEKCIEKKLIFLPQKENKN